MNIIETIFNQKKAVIGMIHLPALPGSAGGKNVKFKYLVSYALSELDALQSGGVDGVIVENFWDLPYYPNQAPLVTATSLASVAAHIVMKAAIPVGVNLLYNDFRAELAIARSLNTAFMRAEVFVDPSLSETGIIQPSAADLIRERAALNADQVAIFADVQGKNTAPMWSRPLLESAVDAEKRGQADAIIITGAGTGKGASADDLRLVREKVSIPLLVGSGVNPASLPELFQYCDGAIVGSYFKKDGKIEAPTDIDRVKELVAARNRIK